MAIGSRDRAWNLLLSGRFAKIFLTVGSAVRTIPDAVPPGVLKLTSFDDTVLVQGSRYQLYVTTDFQLNIPTERVFCPGLMWRAEDAFFTAPLLHPDISHAA